MHLAAYVTVQLTAHSHLALRAFEREVIKFPEVIECYHLLGQLDFILKVAIKDMSEYERFFMNKLSTLPNLGVVETLFVMREGKKETAYAWR